MKINTRRPTSITSQHEYYRNVVERITVKSKKLKDAAAQAVSSENNQG